MALHLKPEEKADLRKAIVKAFTPATLGLLTADYLGEPLFVLSAPDEFPVVVQNVIGWCEDLGWLSKLVRGVTIERPENDFVIKFTRKLGLHPITQPKAEFQAFFENRKLLDVKWFSQGHLMGTRVCQVRKDLGPKGTGFLVGPDAVLTNWHVMQQAKIADGGAAAYEFVFGFARTSSGEVIAQGDSFRAASKWHIASAPEGDAKTLEPDDKELDFALVRLEKPAGRLTVGNTQNGQKRHWIDMPQAPYAFEDRSGLAILEHPVTPGNDRHPLKLAFHPEEKAAENQNKNRVRYKIPTLNGSSGSPVFDLETWQLIALHHVGLDNQYNQGIPIWLIATQPDVRKYIDSIE